MKWSILSSINSLWRYPKNQCINCKLKHLHQFETTYAATSAMLLSEVTANPSNVGGKIKKRLVLCLCLRHTYVGRKNKSAKNIMHRYTYYSIYQYKNRLVWLGPWAKKTLKSMINGNLLHWSSVQLNISHASHNLG